MSAWTDESGRVRVSIVGRRKPGRPVRVESCATCLSITEAARMTGETLTTVRYACDNPDAPRFRWATETEARIEFERRFGPQKSGITIAEAERLIAQARDSLSALSAIVAELKRQNNTPGGDHGNAGTERIRDRTTRFE